VASAPRHRLTQTVDPPAAVLRRRSASAVIVVLVAVVPALLGGWPFVTLLVTIGLIGIRELAHAFRRAGHSVDYRLSGALFLVTLLSIALLRTPVEILLAVSVAVMFPLVWSLTSARHQEALASAALTSLAVLYLALPLGAAGVMRGLEGASSRGWLQRIAEYLNSADTGLGLAWFLWGLSVTWLTDAFAYLFGARFGHTKLVPHLSPGKTRAGALAGLLAGSVTGCLGAAVFGVPLPFWLALLAGLVVSLTAQVGDLAESLMKRAAGLKDLGHLIPGHGGVVDRIDALLFTLPLTLALATLVEEVHWL